jgi:hypothetical protein
MALRHMTPADLALSSISCAPLSCPNQAQLPDSGLMPLTFEEFLGVRHGLERTTRETLVSTILFAKSGGTTFRLSSCVTLRISRAV